MHFKKLICHLWVNKNKSRSFKKGYSGQRSCRWSQFESRWSEQFISLKLAGVGPFYKYLGTYLFFKWPNPGLILFIFVLFTFQFKWKFIIWTIKIKKQRCCVWDSNPGSQDCTSLFSLTLNEDQCYGQSYELQLLKVTTPWSYYRQYDASFEIYNRRAFMILVS